MADSNCEQALGLMSIDENSVSNCWGHTENSSSADLAIAGRVTDLENVDKFKSGIGSSSASAVNPMPRSADQLARLVDSAALKASSAGRVKSMQAACSNALSTDSVMSNPGTKADSDVYFPARHAHTSLSLSFSGLTGESNVVDHQDCVMSSMLVMSEQLWYPTGLEGSSFPPANRDSAVMRYKEKKKARKYIPYIESCI